MKLKVWIAGALVEVSCGSLRECRARRDAIVGGTMANISFAWSILREGL